jgi:peroxisomal membrane protein 2
MQTVVTLAVDSSSHVLAGHDNETCTRESFKMCNEAGDQQHNQTSGVQNSASHTRVLPVLPIAPPNAYHSSISMLKEMDHAKNATVDQESSPLLPLTTPSTASSSPSGRPKSSASARRQDPTNLWRRYSDLIDRRPLLTKAVTATILFLSADLIAQAIEHLLGRMPIDQDDDNSKSGMVIGGVDVPRAARFAAFGLIGAPWSHYYFLYLDRWLPPTEEPWTFRTLTKVVIDQFIQAPLLLAIMIGALSIMKGEGFRGVAHDLTVNFETTLIANCTSITIIVDPKRVYLLLTTVGLFLPGARREAVAAGFYDQHCLCQALLESSLRKRRLHVLDGDLELDAQQVD